MFRTALVRTASFAHLPGFSAAKKRADDEDEAKKPSRARREGPPGEPEEEGTENEASSARAEKDEDNAEGDPEEEGNEDEAKRPAKGKRKRAQAAKDEGDEDGADGRDEDKEEEDDDEGDDESDDDEMRGRKGKKSRAARNRERARCRAIFASPHAAANVQLAAHFAFNSRLPRSEAIAALKHAAGSASSLGARMSGVAVPRVSGAGDGAEQNREASIAASWDASFKRGKRG